MAYLDKYNQRTDDVQDAADEPDEVYTSKIESQLKEYIDANDDLYIAISENDEVLDCLYTMYRAYVNDDERGTNMAASAFLLSMDSVLIERATRNV